MNRPARQLDARLVASVYAFTLALLFTASFWPGARVWGLSVWGYFPIITRIVFLVVGLAAAAAAVFYAHRDQSTRPRSSGNGPVRRMWLIYAGLPLVWGVLCYILRAEAHFLGDGYQQLARLAGDQPLIRARNFGGAALNIWVKGLFGTGELAALHAFRAVAISAGVLFSAVTLYAAHRLFDSLRARLLFALGMLFGGYGLLFFGYVENYAYFGLAVTAFTLAGLLITQGHLRRFWILPALGVAVFFHILGLTLLPAAVYLLMRDTRLSRRFAGLKVSTRGAIWIVLVAKGILLFAYLYNTSYYFRFAFVPLFPGRLVLEGYTLLSIKHIADWANLVLCLSPAFLLLVAFAVRAGGRALWREPAVRFLLIAAAGALAAAFMVDPKLGMARDWDLFAYAGVPMAALFYFLTVRASDVSRGALSAAILGIVLGLSTLLPRAVVQHTPLLAVAQMQNYAHLDVHKNRTGVYTLGQYLLDEGYVSEYREVRDFRDSIYLEDRLSQRAAEAVRTQQWDQARALASQMIAVNPQLFSGWMYLGKSYISTRRYESARTALRIADGLNPQSPGILNELGLAYYNMKEKDKAERVWLRSAALDPGQFPPHFSLARIYRERGDNEPYLHHLRLAAVHAEAPAAVSLELADYYLGRRDFEPAKAAIYRALALGADSASVRALRNKYPGLIEWKD